MCLFYSTVKIYSHHSRLNIYFYCFLSRHKEFLMIRSTVLQPLGMLSHDILDLLVVNQVRRSLLLPLILGADAALKVNVQLYNKDIYY